MLDDLPLPRHQLQGLGYVFAQLMQNTAAARAGRRHRVDHALSRQVLGQGPARRPAPLERRYGHALRRGDLFQRLRLSPFFLQFEQLQLELVEQRAALRGLAEPLVPQLGDLLLELLDLQHLIAHLRAMRLPLRQQHRLEGLDVVGERFGSGGGHSVISGSIQRRCNGDRAAESRYRTVASARHLRP